MFFRRIFRPVLVALLLVSVCACTSKPIVPGADTSRATSAPQPQGFMAGQLGKTDIDRVAETHLRDAYLSLRVLSEKLYRRNPREWKKSGHTSVDAALARIFDGGWDWRFPELEGKQGIDALRLAFRDDYAGDRVLALTAGLGGMIDQAFGGKREFFLLDDLDAQKLYNAARNVEIAAWKLNSSRDAGGTPLLLSNESGPGGNLSFEREFGRLIGNLDILSLVIADKSSRGVVRLVQGIASGVFLPLK